MSDIAKPSNPNDDWKIWMVVNPSTWLMPILFAVLLIVLTVHTVVLQLGWFTWG
ncbi:light-harvesting antenna LH1, alpha subunit [Thiorhodococcus minor]|uniref:Light-harvesting protein n=1 Tax=Thiorhodococcus minor TaxID=57489 RepID=A0A6M0K4S8_9GAMM|nr:light-harvesting antenna LH1, alpha subunit [Thiorhodococcus minor]NEV64786.1 light-harvesting protein [Thiorhodococcus minor]